MWLKAFPCCMNSWVHWSKKDPKLSRKFCKIQQGGRQFRGFCRNPCFLKLLDTPFLLTALHSSLIHRGSVQCQFFGWKKFIKKFIIWRYCRSSRSVKLRIESFALRKDITVWGNELAFVNFKLRYLLGRLFSSSGEGWEESQDNPTGVGGMPSFLVSEVNSMAAGSSYARFSIR